MKKKLFGTSLILLLTGASAFAQPATLDNSFNQKGIKEIVFKENMSSDSIACSVLQPDGKMLLVLNGYRDYGNFQRRGSVIMRLQTDGKPDPSFGLSGRLDLTSIMKGFTGASLALRNDGRVVIGGHMVDEYNSIIPALVGVTADGAKDEMFGTPLSTAVRSGSRLLSDGDNYYGYSYKSLQIDQTTGNIFAMASRIDYLSGYGFVVATVDRFGDENNLLDGGEGSTYILEYIISDYNMHTVAGSLFHASSRTLYIATTVYNYEQTLINKTKQFGIMAISMHTGRPVETFFGGGNWYDQGRAMLPLTPGRKINECTGIQFSADSSNIFLSGYAQKDMAMGETDIDYMVYKIKRQGSIDNTFALDGIATYRYPFTPASIQNFAFSFLVQPNGKMLLGGSVGTGNAFATVMRINADSTVDATFGTNGYVVYNQNNPEIYLSYPGITGIHFRDNKYLLVGSYNEAGYYDAFVKRINSNGSNDNSYGTSSKTLLWAFGENAVVEDAVATSNGGLWACGNDRQIANSGPYALQLNSDGSLGNPGIVSLAAYFANAAMNNPSVTAITLYQGKPLIAGTYYNGAGQPDLFIMQLKADGTLDTEFGTAGFARLNWSSGDHYAHDLVVQEGQGILLYGYFTGAATLVRFSFAGTRDEAFGTGGMYSPPQGTAAGVMQDWKLQVVVTNGKIYGTSTYYSTTNRFLVFRLLETGLADPSFGNNGSLGYYTGLLPGGDNCYPSSLAVRADGSTVVGGYTENYKAESDMVLFLLKANGSSVDSSFNNTGYLAIHKSLEEKIKTVHLENNNTIVATGIAKNTGDYSQVVLRMDAKGVLDKTFNGNGYAMLNEGKSSHSVLVNSSLYFVGVSKQVITTESCRGLVTKVKLGTGSVAKPTTLALPNLSKTFGDQPFKIQAVTNSPAPIVYSIVQSPCATIDAQTGEVTITCATVDSYTPIIVRATQAAANGYAAATATSTIAVEKAYPKVYFPTQGGITGTKFKLQAYAESTLKGNGYYYFTQLNGNDVIWHDYYTDTLHALKEGEAQFEVYFGETRDYRSVSKTATIYIYDAPIPPVANRDAAEFEFGTPYSMEINILENDEAYSGTIVTAYTDLDPSSPGIQDTYVSPSLGLFKADSNGIVTYTPFSGFIGSGDISYTITDSKDMTSEPALIHVAVVSKTQIPALKATELITPNNDGLNDAFVIGYIDLEKQNQLKIFDRNGQELFSQDNYRNDWKGELSNGKQIENGIYFYVFVEGAGNGNSRELKGVVELKR